MNQHHHTEQHQGTPIYPTHFLPLSDAQIARYSSIPTPPPIPGQHYNDLPTTPLHWLFADCLPFGHLTLLEGPSGSGTTLLALSLASRTSNPQPTPNGHPHKPAVTILIAPYHSPTSVTKPRLQALGADLQHILNLSSIQSLNPKTHTIATRPFSLPQDLTLLEDTITRNHARFVIIDPTSAILPASAPRTVLPHLAQRTHCAILLIRPIKAPPANRPLPTRSTCSPEFLAAFASALLALPDPEDPDQCLLITTKHSLTHPPNTLLYHIITAEGTQPTITWLGEREPTPDLSPDPSQRISELRTLILGILSSNTKALDAPAITDRVNFYIQYSYDAVRKALQRMLTSGELVSPARGLYTTPGHPCLTQLPPIPTADSSVPNVPTNQPDILVPPTNSTDPSLQTAYGRDSSRPVHLATDGPIVPVQIVPTDQPDIPTTPAAIVPVPNVQLTDTEPSPVHTVQSVAPEMPDPNCYYGHPAIQQTSPDSTGSPLPNIQCYYGHPAVQQAPPDGYGDPSPDFLCIYGHRSVQKVPPDPTVYPPVQSVDCPDTQLLITEALNEV